MRVYRGMLTLHEHTYFASRELGIVYQTEPLIGNYALAYALGLCHVPYRWDGGPRYREDLEPVNARGVYVTPATFDGASVRFAVTQFNAQSDAYWSAFVQNAIQVDRLAKPPRASNFPQSGRIRMLALGSRALFYLLSEREPARRPAYVRLGKFHSKARIEWEEIGCDRREGELHAALLLNAVDLPRDLRLIAYNQVSVHPAPLLRDVHAVGRYLALEDGAMLPMGMRFGGKWE